MKKTEITKELLIKHDVRVELKENGQPVIYQKKQKFERPHPRNKNKTYIPDGGELPWSEERYEIDITKKHKYGKDKTYKYVALRFNTGPLKYVAVSIVVYIWFTGNTIPAGYDVDHIDGDTFNNNPDNLQLLTRKENINKRSGFKNQWDIFNYQEFGEEYLKLKPMWLEFKEHLNNTTYWPFKKWYYQIYKEEVDNED